MDVVVKHLVDLEEIQITDMHGVIGGDMTNLLAVATFIAMLWKIHVMRTFVFKLVGMKELGLMKLGIGVDTHTIHRLENIHK
jgi:hypothetical protein